MVNVDHPYTDPGDGRTECDACGKWIFEVTHSCKRVPVTEAARARYAARLYDVPVELVERRPK
jgi:hypothetical protein